MHMQDKLSDPKTPAGQAQQDRQPAAFGRCKRHKVLSSSGAVQSLNELFSSFVRGSASHSLR